MTKAQRRALGHYCRDIADKLELRDWTINVGVADPGGPDRPDDKTWGASSESQPGRKYVDLTFRPDCIDWSREELRVTVAHELVHPHFHNLVEMVRVDLHEHLAGPTYDIFEKSFTRWLEYGVDAMADALARELPLIEWPKPPKRKVTKR